MPGQGEGGGEGGSHTPLAAGARHSHGLPHHPAHPAAAAAGAAAAGGPGHQAPGGVTAGSPSLPPRTLIEWPHQQGGASAAQGGSADGRGVPGGGRTGGGAVIGGSGGGVTGAGAGRDAGSAHSSSGSRHYGGAASEGSVEMEHSRLSMWGVGEGGRGVREGGGKASEEGWIARLAAMLVGEDPTQCYALICRSCHTHNGECVCLS